MATATPTGLPASEIPLGSRIIGVCDAYEAMTERAALPRRADVDEALAELRASAGTQFDPQLVELFCEVVREGLPAPVSTA